MEQLLSFLSDIIGIEIDFITLISMTTTAISVVGSLSYIIFFYFKLRKIHIKINFHADIEEMRQIIKQVLKYSSKGYDSTLPILTILKKYYRNLILSILSEEAIGDLYEMKKYLLREKHPITAYMIFVIQLISVIWSQTTTKIKSLITSSLGAKAEK